MLAGVLLRYLGEWFQESLRVGSEGSVCVPLIKSFFSFSSFGFFFLFLKYFE